MAGTFSEALRSWQNFYFMTGGAAATLAGLMFVALSLGTHLIGDTTRHLFNIFVTPSVIYFVSVLLLSAVMLIPAETPVIVAAILLPGGAVGMGMAAYYVRHLIRAAGEYQDFGVADWLAQVVLPLVGYLLILAAGAGFATDEWRLALMGLWLAPAALLICAIANTWSLVLWIIEQRRE
jgi:hypothetical protein